jgi:hypothetical protein
MSLSENMRRRVGVQTGAHAPVDRGLRLVCLYALALLDEHFNNPSRMDKVLMLLGWAVLIGALLPIGIWILVTFGTGG